MPGTTQFRPGHLPAAIDLDVVIGRTESGRKSTTVRYRSQVDLGRALTSGTPAGASELVNELTRVVQAGAGGRTTSWPIASGRSVRDLTPRTATRYGVLGLVLSNSTGQVPYGRAIERGSYNPRTGYRRKGLFVFRNLFRRIRHALLRPGGDVDKVMGQAVRSAWAKAVRQARRAPRN